MTSKNNKSPDNALVKSTEVNYRDDVKGSPDKYFFVAMLTRDIELEDAILDLVDNCIDGALRVRCNELEEKDRFDGYWAKINVNEKDFEIEDNCGGIPWEIAKSVAFRNGAPPNANRPEGSIGTVGIGMKRAIFKLGRSAIVFSDTSEDSYYVEIPSEWIEEQTNWDFRAYNQEKAVETTGTQIQITDLLDSAKKSFTDGAFLTDLKTKISDTYHILISKGFKIYLNGVEVPGRNIEMCYEETPDNDGKFIRPFLWKYETDDTKVFIAIGYRRRIRKEDPTNPHYETKTAGISVICNNRVVLPYDKTHRTGWGVGDIASFHNQFSSIVGVVDMWSAKISNLPITTTKNGVDLDSDLYQLIRNALMQGIKIFTSNTTSWKKNESEVKRRFDNAPRRDLSAIKACSVGLSWSAKKSIKNASIFKPDLPRKVLSRTDSAISFRKPKSDIRLVSEFLFDDENEAPKRVGEGTFDYVLKAAEKTRRR
ncbi:MAG: ATP-binding protein [Opitutales bacterium]|nr:ATP-binding protein [Opitutales bacterium]